MESRRKPGRDGRSVKPGRPGKRDDKRTSGYGNDRLKKTDGKPRSARTESKSTDDFREKRTEGRDYKKPYRSADKDGATEGRKYSKPYGSRSTESSGSSRPYGKTYKRSDDSAPTEKRNYGKPYRSRDTESGDKKRTFAKSGNSSADNHSGESRPFKRPYVKRDNDRNEGFSSSRKPAFGGERRSPATRPPRKSYTDRDTTENTENTFERSASFDDRSSIRNTDRPYNRKQGSYARQEKPKEDDGRVRLNKLIAASGICSRREADDMIVAGLVSVNGVIISQLGTKVSPEDEVKYNGERIKREKLVYLLLNKPKDYVTTLRDPHAKQTVLELIAGACKERVFPVGRLDRNTTGVLLLTNDGDLTKKLTHPSHNRKKIYHVHLDKNIKHDDMLAIAAGIELEDGFIKADEITFVDPVDKKQIGIEIHSGRNRIVRRIFERFDYKVDKLDRVYFCGLTKKGLQRGQWRFLTGQEVGMLKMGSYE